MTLLQNGAISVRKAAELSELNRGTVYDILKELQKKGLVSFYHLDTKQLFVAEEPNKLLKVLSDREEELKNIKDKIEKIIPELKSLQGKDENKPVTKFYEGKEGIRFILDDILSVMGNRNTGDNKGIFESDKDVQASFEREYFVYSAAAVRDDIYAAYPDFNKKRIKSGIKVKTISLSKGGATYGLDERKWLSANEDSPTYILIYKNKCAFIARDSGNNPVGVIIENKMIYGTQKLIFLKLWELLNYGQ